MYAVTEGALAHAVGEGGQTHRLQVVTAAERLGLDLLQTLGQVDGVQLLAVLKGAGADQADTLVHVDDAAVVLALFQLAVVQGQTIHGLGGQIADHSLHQLVHILCGAVVGVVQQNLKGGGHNGVVLQIDGVQTLAVLTGDDNLHTAEGRGHRGLGYEQNHSRAVLDAVTQLVTEVVAVLAGLVVPDAVLSVIQRVQDGVHLGGVAVGIADEQVGLVAVVGLELGEDDGEFRLDLLSRGGFGSVCRCHNETSSIYYNFIMRYCLPDTFHLSARISGIFRISALSYIVVSLPSRSSERSFRSS